MEITPNKDVIDELEELRNENRILRKIIDEIPSSIYWKDVNGIYLGRNTYSVKKMIEQGFEESHDRNFIVGKTDFELFSKEIAEQFRANDLKILQSGKEYAVEESFLGMNGQPYHHLSIKKPLYDEIDRPIGIVGISIDITERKNAEEREKLALAQATEAKIKAEVELRQAIMILAGSIVHDLRTPIASLAMPSKVLNSFWPILMDAYDKAKAANLPLKSINRDQLEILKKMDKKFEEVAQQLQEFISVTLKTISKTLQRKLAQEDLVLCSIWHCVFNTLQRYPLSEEERALVQWEQKYNYDFMGNEILMVRILFNLLNNALHQIKKNQRGKIFLYTEDGGTVNILRFKDTAGGAPPEVVNHLFDGYLTTKKDGTGVGMAFCKLTMKNFEGDITCHSMDGDYMEFVLTFPKLKT